MLCMELNENFPDLANSKLNQSTVSRIRNKLGLHFLPARRNCALTLQCREKRIQWCMYHLQQSTDWEKIIFSDESWFEQGSRKRWLWRHHDDYGEDVMIEKIAHPKKLMIWGAIGHNFKSKIVFIEENITGNVYFDNIIKSFGRCRKCLWVQ